MRGGAAPIDPWVDSGAAVRSSNGAYTRGRLAFPDVNESTAYAILRRLLGDGKLAVTQGQESEGASRRKYYSLTELGNRSLEEARESWREISRTVAGFGI